MRFRLFPKSAGIRVSRRTHAFLDRANRTRDAGKWRAAADLYASALERDPGLAHIWIQLGHAWKEAGLSDRAEAAYSQAASLRPADAEPHFFLGHLLKSRDSSGAARHFLEALRRNNEQLDLALELIQLLDGETAPGRAMLNEVVALTIPRDRQRATETATAADYRASVLLDVSDLLSYFSRARLPTGIQRVQIEVARALIAARPQAGIALCCYSNARRGWSPVPHGLFDRICIASLASDDKDAIEWRQDLLSLHIDMAQAGTVPLPASAILINLGSGWSDSCYLLDVRTAAYCAGLTYVPLIYDIIPILSPQWFVPSLVRSYAAWFGSLMGTARGFIAISEATKRDLLDVARSGGTSLPDDLVRVVSLDGDFRASSTGSAKGASAAPSALLPHADRRFVLMVSTLEPRKNHVGAFRAWRLLLDRLGPEAVPSLICVGGRGWLNAEMHAMLDADPLLRKHVTLLSGLSDRDLDQLYRHCLFALYPSFYEGWGLPVSEALGYGKAVAISRTSSLPEAGGPWARYFDPHDAENIAAVVEPLILDDAARTALEERIATEFRPRPWAAIAAQMLEEARTIADRLGRDGTPAKSADIGTHTLSLSTAEDSFSAMQDGEAFRIGAGWGARSDQGSLLSPPGALLRFRLADETATFIMLHFAAPENPTSFAAKLEDQEVAETVTPGSTAQVTFALPSAGSIVTIDIQPTAPGSLYLVRFEIL